MMRGDEAFMRRCLELAVRGAGTVSPNPMVGSVVVHEGRVIGEGWHERYGGPHAEVNAIASVREPELLPASTLYVNLEPCSHFGKTPPCSDLIVSTKIPRVVVGCVDPHEKVAGRGITRLREAGVDVSVGILGEESERINEAFMTSHRKGRPFVMLKIAQTLDGRIATSLGASKWITGEESRLEVHRLRSRFDAVLTSSSTAVFDDAELTVRHCEGRQPLRVLLDRQLRVPLESKLFGPEARTLVFASADATEPARVAMLGSRGVEVVTVPSPSGRMSLQGVLAELHRRRVLSVMVEAGSSLAAAFVRERLADKLCLFVAPRLFGGDGLPSLASLDVLLPGQSVNLRFSGTRMAGMDLMIEAYFD
ncbi:MAG: bifunctional diaminohydroxyphosphoribosylaminopyrimidine deaminase/5-amino-6-(5-phosphoribosylamino)uracil reductase RibD [Chlorobiaceae bacterium]|nr:bifunctional diaminohydroxyphosphoribosylaminopyrimidine deaminase/5-amino-6-(5-phosphoribosylamino)uracil reductase RibD [Chlorobiaceae bacterium]